MIKGKGGKMGYQKEIFEESRDFQIPDESEEKAKVILSLMNAIAIARENNTKDLDEDIFAYLDEEIRKRMSAKNQCLIRFSLPKDYDYFYIIDADDEGNALIVLKKQGAGFHKYLIKAVNDTERVVKEVDFLSGNLLDIEEYKGE